ncbi:MAG TPA: hypothetical protein VMU50_21985, partial [Polyangia bacterium]|nr:hypothetical protein [Polyangia bacterium]
MDRSPAARALTLALATVTATMTAAASARAQAPAAGDDRYRFAAGASQAVSLPLTATPAGARAAWPPAPAARTGWDTALAGVVIASAGLAETSWIDVSAGDGSGNASRGVHVRQHLDAGARGLRWVNISPLRAALIGGATLTFETHAATLGPGAVTVRLFWNGVALERPLLVLAPHPDDAEIAAFGLYAQARAATIVTVTA